MKKVCKEFFNFFFSLCDLTCGVFTNVAVLLMAAQLILPDDRYKQVNKWISPWDAKGWLNKK